jgi:hypothetical protein
MFSASMQLFRCALGSHKPVREDVDWDGRNYVSNCRGCGRRIRRSSYSDWRKDWLKD